MNKSAYNHNKAQPESSRIHRCPTGATNAPAAIPAYVGLHRRLGNAAMQCFLQAKLAVSRPGDVYEQEADRVADQVMRMPEPTSVTGKSLPPRVQRVCPSCEEDLQRQAPKEEEELLQTKPVVAEAVLQRKTPLEEEELQRKAPLEEEELQRRTNEANDAAVVNSKLEDSIQALAGRGNPLPDSVRSFMEPRFGADFSQVRLHTDAQAGELARAVNAQAFTVGRDVVFGAGHYVPETEHGRQLIAHELVHVVQQGDGVQQLQRRSDCPRRPAGEVAQSRSGFLNSDDRAVFTAASNRLDVRDFAVNDATLPAGVVDSPPLQRVISLIRGDPSIGMVVVGFSDCVGSIAENAAVRRRREQTILAVMPSDVRAKRVLGSWPNPIGSYADTNLTAEGRARNRSVRVLFASGLWPSSLPSTQRGDPCDRIRRASNLDEYLFLVRCMESRLGLGTPAQAPTALSVLRQIYYGAATWSQSRTSVWSDVISSPPWSPGNDPGPRLGAVMPALRASQVVETTDIGHVLTGIDAMLNPHEVVLSFGSRVQVQLPTGVKNEEWATWAGDVGSAAAEWAADQYALTSRGNFDFYFGSYADPDDLYGDIDAFTIRAGLTGATPGRQLGSAIRLSGTLSEVLLQYFRLTRSRIGQPRQGRVRNFIQVYGGTIVNASIANRPVLIQTLRPSIDGFANFFFMNLVLTRGTLNNPPAGAPNPAITLTRGVDEITERFVRWLELPAHLR